LARALTLFLWPFSALPLAALPLAATESGRFRPCSVTRAEPQFQLKEAMTKLENGESSTRILYFNPRKP